MEIHSRKLSAIEQIAPIIEDTKDLPTSSSSPVHAAPEVIGIGREADGETAGKTADEVQASRGRWFAYLRTRNFYLVLLLG